MNCNENPASDDSFTSDDEDENDRMECSITEPTKCLFCEIVSNSIELAIKHLKTDHNFNLIQMKNKFNMDQYSYIKMVNYIRTHKIKSIDLQFADKVLWNDEKYLKPVEYEPWLTYDFESLEASNYDLVQEKDMSVEKVYEIEIQQLKEKLAEKDELLKQAHETIKQLRSGFRKIIDKDIDNEQMEIKENSIANVSLKADESYFTSYAHFSIHYEMISDAVRTSSYRDAILHNKEIFQNRTVLDVGCGTSILSMFSAQAGAKRVIAIDNSEIIFKAMGIARENNFGNIDFVKGRLEDTVLPLDRFDIIISEWMGYFLIFEGMLDSIIYARDRHLKVKTEEDYTGIIMPNRCNISLLGYGDVKRHQDYIEFWDSVYGFNMSSMKNDVLQEPVVEICDPEFVLTEPNVIIEYDLNTVTLNYSNFSIDFEMKVTKTGKLTAFVGYFDTFFDLPKQKVSFSTSPWDKPTHWKQVAFFIEKPISVNQGDVINGKIKCRRNLKDMRSLDISIKAFNKEYNYRMD